jgi:hypothetical protein
MRVKRKASRNVSKKKKLTNLDKYVIFSLGVCLLYTLAHSIIFVYTGLEASTLTTCCYACFGGEVVVCALIKIFKLKDNENGGETDE